MGVLTGGGTVDAPIGRHPTQRVKMAVVADGKPAVTHYRVMDRYIHHTRIRLRLETGRTHQIRVHMAHIGYPLVGDPVYAGRFGLPAKINEELRAALRGFKRQALHATRLAFAHPITGEPLQFDAPLPQDMVDLIAVLEQFRDDC